jgi:molybdopterin-guanine dinucleotide biosynthesis protein A
LSRAIDRLHPQTEELAISYNGDAAVLPPGFSVLPDAAVRGPLAGVLAGMNWAAEQGAAAIVTAAVDTPFFPCDLVPRLHMAGEGRLAIALAQRAHPTFGLWPIKLRTDLAAFLASDANPKVMDFCTQHSATFAQFADESAFANINTPDDLAAIQALLA